MIYPHDEYVAAVERERWPEDPRVPERAPHYNEAGVIYNILMRPVGGVAVIRSAHGSVRSNHYHKTDWHYLHVLEGRILYFEREMGSTLVPNPYVVYYNQTVFTAPGREHAVVSVGVSVLLSLSKHARTHEAHEADLVRVPFISKDAAYVLAESYRTDGGLPRS
jgi:hypothetical protein